LHGFQALGSEGGAAEKRRTEFGQLDLAVSTDFGEPVVVGGAGRGLSGFRGWQLEPNQAKPTLDSFHESSVRIQRNGIQRIREDRAIKSETSQKRKDEAVRLLRAENVVFQMVFQRGRNLE